MPKNYILELCAIDLSKLSEKQKVSPIGKATGRDGRVFNIDGNSLLEKLTEDGLQIPLTVGHEWGGKAAGWFSEFELKDDGLYASLKLNKLGKELIEAEEYKYLSPEYWVDYDTNQVELMPGVSLVNQPNLLKEALNHMESNDMPAPKESNDLTQQVETLTEQNTTLAKQNDELLKQISTNKVDAAIAGGKLAPAKRDYALGLEANSLDGYLTLEAQTFKATENNSLNAGNKEGDDEDDSGSCDIANQFNA